jgi:hypothetical protein
MRWWNRSVERCRRASARIAEGIDLLESDPQAEEAFRFANHAMWQQRIRSTYARLVRKKDLPAGAPVDPLDIPKNRTWRLFQLAFVLLNLPSLTGLDHPERSHETDAVADLLWFATGGGKTEAYLGLTAYTVGLRRLQGEIEGRSSCGGRRTPKMRPRRSAASTIRSTCVRPILRTLARKAHWSVQGTKSLSRKTLLSCLRGPFCNGKAIRLPKPPCGIVS